MFAFVIAADHPSLPGHFPGRPLVPGVVLLDRVFDAIDAGHSGPAPAPSAGPLRLPQVKFLQPLLPDEAARVELQRGEGDVPRWRFRVLRGDDLLATGEVVTDTSGAAC